MARGWESKAIEDQQAEAERAAAEAKRTRLSPVALALRQRRETLELMRSQLQQQLAQASHTTYQTQLKAALQQLEEELTQLASAPTQESA